MENEKEGRIPRVRFEDFFDGHRKMRRAIYTPRPEELEPDGTLKKAARLWDFLACPYCQPSDKGIIPFADSLPILECEDCGGIFDAG